MEGTQTRYEQKEKECTLWYLYQMCSNIHRKKKFKTPDQLTL